jgi:hypothetical protein
LAAAFYPLAFTIAAFWIALAAFLAFVALIVIFMICRV